MDVDAGYAATAITQGLKKRNNYVVIGYRILIDRDGNFYKREYRYDEKPRLHLPNGQLLSPQLFDDEPRRLRQYHSTLQQCRNCPMRQKCMQSSNAIKVVKRHVWESNRERIDQHRLSRMGKRIYKQRRQTVERSFAEAKQLHGHCYARFRGLTRVQQQCLLATTAQNIKKIALLLSRLVPSLPTFGLHTLFAAEIEQIRHHLQIALVENLLNRKSFLLKQTPPKWWGSSV